MSRGISPSPIPDCLVRRGRSERDRSPPIDVLDRSAWEDDLTEGPEARVHRFVESIVRLQGLYRSVLSNASTVTLRAIRLDRRIAGRRFPVGDRR